MKKNGKKKLGGPVTISHEFRTKETGLTPRDLFDDNGGGDEFGQVSGPRQQLREFLKAEGYDHDCDPTDDD